MFWWLNKLLRSLTSANERLEEITMTVGYYFGPLEVSMAHWKDVVNALLCAQPPRLKKLNIIINQGQSVLARL